MGNEIVDQNQIDRSNAHYMIEGIAKALNLDANLFKNNAEIKCQTHNLKYLFETPKKNISNKVIAICVLVAFSPLFYIGINEFLRVGFTHSLNILLLFQIIAVVFTIIGIAFVRCFLKR